MKRKTITSLAALFVAATLVVVALNYTSPVASRIVSGKALRTAAPSCSTITTLPYVGASYARPDSFIIQLSLRAPSPHAAPSCSVFGRGTYGSYLTTDWTPWAFIFKADSGSSWHEVGRPWSGFDFVWLKFKLFGSDTCVVNATCKYLGEVNTAHTEVLESVYTTVHYDTTVVRMPWHERTIDHTSILDDTTDLYIYDDAQGATITLLPASSFTKPFYFTAAQAPMTPVSFTCDGADQFYQAGPMTAPQLVKAGDVLGFLSNQVDRWTYWDKQF